MGILQTIRKGYPLSGLNPNIFDDWNTTLTPPTPYVNWANPALRAAALGTTEGLVEGFTGITGNAKKGLLGKLGKGTMGGALLNMGAGILGGAAKNAISGGLSSGAGDAISGLGSMAGGIVGSFNPIAGAVVNFASNLVGGFTNRMFGSKLNLENIANIKTNINDVMNAGFDNTSGRALLNSYSYGPKLGGFSLSDVGEDGWFSNTARNTFNDLKKQANYAGRLYATNLGLAATNLNDNLIMSELSNSSAFGGPILIDPSTAIGYSLATDRYIKDMMKNNYKGEPNTLLGTPDSMLAFGGDISGNGADFTTKLIHIGTGNTHELNPLGGVLIGVDSESVPNLVEEGETIYNDYVFSNRLTVPSIKRGKYRKRNVYAEGGYLDRKKSNEEEVTYEEKVLKPFEGMTFADASKKAEKLSGIDERPVDPISLRGFNVMMLVLTESQEKEREKERQEEIAETLDNMSPEELAMLQLQMLANQQQANEQVIALQQQMIPQGMEQLQEQPEGQQPIAALGGLLDNWKVNNTYATGGDIDNFNTINTSQEVNMFEDGGFEDWWNKYITTPVIKSRVVGPDYGALYKAFTGKDDLKDSEDVYNALQQLYLTNPEKFTAYDLRTNNFVDVPEPIDSPIEEVVTSEEPVATIEEPLTSEEKVNGPEAAAFNYYNSRHSDKPLTAKQWNALGEREKGIYIKQYKGTLGKEDKVAFDESLTAYNKEQELKDKVAKYQEQQAKSSVNLDDLKDISYDNLERIAEVVNPNYTKKSLQGLSVDDEKKTIDDLRNNIVEWAKGNEKGTLEYLNKVFGAPKAHNSWARTALDDETRWTPSGYDLDEFKTRTANYNGSLTPGNLAGNYAPDADFDLGDFLDVNALEADLSYKNYTDKVRDAIERNKDVKFRFKEGVDPSYAALEYAEGSPTLSEEDYNTLRLLLRQVERTKTNPNGDYVPIFNIDDDGYRSFNQEIKHNNKTYTPWDYFNHLRNDQILGAMHLTPKESKGSELYTLNDKDYYKLSDIEAKTPDWLKYYVEAPETTRLEDGTIVHKLSYQDPLNFARATGTPEDIEVKPDETYAVKGSEGNDPFPKAPDWPYLLGAGLLLGSLGYNLLSPVDYSNANAIINASKEAGRYEPISFTPVGERLRYNPFDINYTANQLRAAELANARALINASNGNIGATQAGLLANNYNNQIALGNAYRLAFEYNDANRAKTAEFNRGTDEFNSEGFLKADMANLEAAARARGYTLEGLKNGYAMRLAVEDAKASAISAGISGLANAAYNYALNKYNTDILGWRMRRGVDAPGIYYKEDSKRSKGGTIKKRRKGLGF